MFAVHRAVGHSVKGVPAHPDCNRHGVSPRWQRRNIMKRGFSIILAASTAVLLVTTGQPSFAGSALTQDEITRALRPVPQALQGGHQGLPTIGLPVRPEPDPSY